VKRTRFVAPLFTFVLGAVFLTGCPKPNGYALAPAAPGATFGGMLGLQEIPGEPGQAAVVTQDGVIYRVSLHDANQGPSVFLDIRGRIIVGRGDEEGLLGLAFAPDYATSRRFYVHYSAGEPRRSVIARYAAPGAAADPNSEHVILEVPQPYANHNGGALAFGLDGMLYIALGDGGDAGDPHQNAQNPNSLLGKILRLDVSRDRYAIPRGGNPAPPGGRPEIFAMGFRNPWRISFDRETGQLWAGDVGQGRWEEVDRVIGGGNYGWDIREGYDCFGATRCPDAGLIPPRVTYRTRVDGTCAVVGGYVYRGVAMPELRGWYVYGDFCSGHIWAVNAGADDGGAIPLTDTDVSISSFGEDALGELYVVTFNNAIYRLVRRP
jgi:glucose/arabinose dehydrogenase